MKDFIIVLAVVVYTVVNIIDIAHKSKSSKRKTIKFIVYYL